MWVTARARQSFAMIGLIITALLACLALENHWFIVPTVLTYGLTKLGIQLIPWRG